MIIIWDNGEQYDGHQIRFFEQKTPNGYVSEDQHLFDLVPVIERLLRYDPMDPNAKRSRVIAVAHDPDFRNGFEPEPLADALWPSRLFKWRRPVAEGGTGPSNVVPRDEAWQLGRSLVALLVVRWKEWIGKRPDPIVGVAYGRVFIEAADAWTRSADARRT